MSSSKEERQKRALAVRNCVRLYLVKVFGAWKTNASAKLSDLESAITKRLKRSLDSYEPQEGANDSFDTIPLGDDTLTTVPKANGQEDILLLMCKHMREQSMKLDILVETVRKLLGRQRLLESMIQQHAKTSGPVASQLPRNPLDHHLRSAAEFRHLNVQLLDKSFRQELTSFLTYLGGQNIDEFVKRIFFAVFDDEISLYVNFKGRKTKESLCGSKLYEVILEVFGAWNTDSTVQLSDLELALTKRLKRSLDSCVQRRNKSQLASNDSDNIPGSSTDSSPDLPM
nr:unnamed protein product [Spirometra erinaceieuropaei]